MSANSSWLQWLMFFLEGVVQQAQHSTDHAIKIMELQLDWKQRLEDRNATANWIKFTENLFSRPVVTIPQAAEMTDMTWRAANKMVNGLIEAKVLTRYGQQDHPKVFHAKEIFDLFEDE